MGLRYTIEGYLLYEGWILTRYSFVSLLEVAWRRSICNKRGPAPPFCGLHMGLMMPDVTNQVYKRARSAVNSTCSCKYSWTMPLSSFDPEFLLLDTVGLLEMLHYIRGSEQNTTIRVTYAVDRLEDLVLNCRESFQSQWKQQWETREMED